MTNAIKDYIQDELYRRKMERWIHKDRPRSRAVSELGWKRIDRSWVGCQGERRSSITDIDDVGGDIGTSARIPAASYKSLIRISR